MGLGFWGFLSFLTGLRSFPFFTAYLFVVGTWRHWRKALPPMELRKPMLLHNLVCVILSAVTLLGMGVCVLFRAPHIYSRQEDWLLTAFFRLYWFTKYFEWLDTAFMMLRHKARQISFLHVYHHSAMVVLADYAANVSPWPCMGLPLGLNSAVHVAVYAYYALASTRAVGERWKRALTQIQMAQFLIGLAYCSVGYASFGFCPYSILFGLSMLYLFGNFYIKAYHRKQKLTTNGISNGISNEVKEE